MSKQDADYGWVSWAVVAIIGLIFVTSLIISNNQKNDIPKTTNTLPGMTTQSAPGPAQPGGSWHCVDATSYNQNAYDDNRCTNGSETRLVSDSQARSLDPDYSPGKAGASYYNNR